MTARLLHSIVALGCVVTCLVIVAGSPVARGQAPVTTRAMALTFDDLPFVAAGEAYFPAATRTTSELLQVLRRHRAPAIGFVNEGVLRRYFDGDGELGDLVMYAMTRDDWEEVSDGWTSTG